MTGPTGLHPRSVTPGIENQPGQSKVHPNGIYCRLDWIRFTGPDHDFDRVAAFLDQRFGPSTGSNGGAVFFKQGLLWDPGVMLSSGHKAGILMLDIQGQRLSTLSGLDGIQLMRDIAAMHMKATRLDGAIDFIGQDVRLYEHALLSCQRNELCGPRTYSPDPEYRADGTVTRLLLKLGKRGSSVCVRIYDKGLETKAADLSRWERLETEFKGSRAQSVEQALYHAADPISKLASRVVGAFDFRISNGRTEKVRRPRARWWASLVSDLNPIETPAQQSTATLDSLIDWYIKAVIPRALQLAEIAGVPVGLLAERIAAHVKPRTMHDLIAVEFQSVVQSGQLESLFMRSTQLHRGKRSELGDP